MIGFLLIALAFAVSTGATAAETVQPRELMIDAKRSHLKWTGRKLTGEHFGQVKFTAGKVTVIGKDIVGGKFDVDMGTIAVDDIKDAKTNTKLRDHLKSEDFFNVQKFPKATLTIFQVKRFEPNDPAMPNYEISGNLEILGVVHPVTIPATIKEDKGMAVATGKLNLDRTLWGIRYGSGKFFKSLGDKLIYDEFTVEFEVAAPL